MFRSIGNFDYYPGRGDGPGDVEGVVIGKGGDLNSARGYREAGDLLSEVVQRESASSYSELALPALFCYRHALELILKRVIGEVEAVFKGEANGSGTPPPPSIGGALAGTHSLYWLEAELTVRLRYYDYDFLVDAHRATIARLHQIDPGGMSFRYSKNKNGGYLLPNGWEVDFETASRSVGQTFDQLELLFWLFQGFALSNPIDHGQLWSY